MTDAASRAERESLPIPDYDHLPVGSLGHRVRSVDAGGLQQLIDYERAHGNRVPVLQVLTARLEALNSGAELSGGSPGAEAADVTAGLAGGSPVSPATEGPKINPPSQGVPTNPAQPRTTG